MDRIRRWSACSSSPRHADRIEAVVGWARVRGAADLTVWITANNEPAHALYRRCSFHLTGATKPNAHTPTLPELEMARNLE